jgi:hypothetical protein
MECLLYPKKRTSPLASKPSGYMGGFAPDMCARHSPYVKYSFRRICLAYTGGFEAASRTDAVYASVKRITKGISIRIYK